jgi:crossover junction endodeoxyribonuclease RuvC
MKIDVYIGIDPGKSGGIAVVHVHDCETYIEAIATPLAGKTLDIARIYEFLYNHTEELNAIAVVEKVHAMPGQGVSSMFSFGYTVGVIHGVITSLGVPLYLIAPQTWKKSILADTKKDKDAAIEFCRRVYPSVELLATPRSKKPHSGIADALCLAHYGYERFKDVE